MLRSRLVYYFMEHKISPDTALLEHNQVQLAESPLSIIYGEKQQRNAKRTDYGRITPDRRGV